MRKRLGLMGLTACLVLVAVFANVFIFSNLDHDCCHNNCAVCLQIQAAQNLLEGLGRVAAIAFCTGFAVCTGAFGKNPASADSSLPTPVTLKVKFNS